MLKKLENSRCFLNLPIQFQFKHNHNLALPLYSFHWNIYYLRNKIGSTLIRFKTMHIYIIKVHRLTFILSRTHFYQKLFLFLLSFSPCFFLNNPLKLFSNRGKILILKIYNNFNQQENIYI